ncbi:MAG: hypothetical protein NVS3B12_30510 [Acidimicrobiales bacterium]
MSDPSSVTSLDDLEAALVAAMAPPHIQPPLASIVAVRAAALDRRVTSGPVMVLSAPRWRHRAALIIAIAGVGTFGSAGVALARPALPNTLRQLAHTIGLPVDTQPVADVRSDSRELQRALDHGDPDRVRRDLQDLDRSEARLDPRDHARVVAPLGDLEQRARAVSGGVAPSRSETPFPLETDHDAPPPSPDEHPDSNAQAPETPAQSQEDRAQRATESQPAESVSVIGAPPRPSAGGQSDTAPSDGTASVPGRATDTAHTETTSTEPPDAAS